MAKKKETTNTTLLRLKNTPFKSATELKQHEERILREEWENIERAKQRRVLLQKDENKEVIGPFLKGFKAKYTGADQNSDHLVRVYLADDESIKIDIDETLKSKDGGDTIENLVKSLTESFVSGYLSALGLKNESLFQTTSKSGNRSK